MLPAQASRPPGQSPFSKKRMLSSPFETVQIQTHCHCTLLHNFGLGLGFLNNQHSNTLSLLSTPKNTLLLHFQIPSTTMTGVVVVSNNGCMGGERERGQRQREPRKETTFKGKKLESPNHNEKGDEQQISLVAILVAALRKSVVACRLDNRQDDDVAVLTGMEISWPMDVRHVAHVTFDRFNGFLGLPVEFEMEVPSRAPSARSHLF